MAVRRSVASKLTDSAFHVGSRRGDALPIIWNSTCFGVCSLRIVPYPHPTLRHKSKPIRRVDKELGKIIEQMFELMYEANGIGLAANQVDLPFRLFIANLAATKGEGEELVFINPVVSLPRGNEEKEEGCLSLPGVYAPVKRPEKVHFSAYSLNGEEMSGDVDGLLARVIQHETDHLDGVLFIDRLSKSCSMELEAELGDMEATMENLLEQGIQPTPDEVAKRLGEFENKYC
jgi:peptide deformylase